MLYYTHVVLSPQALKQWLTYMTGHFARVEAKRILQLPFNP